VLAPRAADSVNKWFNMIRESKMSRFLGIAVAGLTTLGMCAAALAAAPSSHVRGTIDSVSGNTLTVKTYEGASTKLMLKSSTKYAWVVPAKLSSLKKGEFIGTAAQGPEDNLVAQEVVIFPKSMRGSGEGHYPWSMPAAVAKSLTGNGIRILSLAG
jgi:hypothetical protein